MSAGLSISWKVAAAVVLVDGLDSPGCLRWSGHGHDSRALGALPLLDRLGQLSLHLTSLYPANPLAFQSTIRLAVPETSWYS